MIIKGKQIYCIQKKRFYFVSTENNDYIKLRSTIKGGIFQELQFSRAFFIDLVKKGHLIIS